MALVNRENITLEAGDDASDAAWFEVSRLADAGDLAFDHATIIAYAVERLRNKIDYTDIAFNLLPELFTLTELQQVFEQILGKPLLAPAFRRKMSSRVEATQEFTHSAGHRPSRLYRRK
jgi:hypothetical protein